MSKTYINILLYYYFRAITYLKRTDLSNICNLLNVLGGIKWRVNKRVLEMIEYSWSIGGGLGEVPKRFNER